MRVTRLRISIITPSYNQAQFIERAIASVLCQTGPFDLEYLVFDGGSEDGTLEILHQYHDRLSWQSGRDQGQIDALNTGLRRATGEVVGWLNSDDVLAPGALAKVAEVFTRRPEVEWVHGRCDIIAPDDRRIRPWISAYKHWRCGRYSYARLLTENFISQMTVFWRRRLLDETGLLDTSLSLAFDYDLWLRFGKRSDPFYIPERLASFRWYETSKSGAHLLQQLAEDHLVARRHGLGGWRQWRKRLQTVQRLTIYHLLRWGCACASGRLPG